uniref:NADH-ubiquinone oxidoreductase chain 5 n=1 Tax=Bovicola ovis TaxID=186214 RepID=A0A386B291_9NEOP|nr:NADH dehydrogenase subunit 5 [Bovicola ovis]
MKSDKKFFPSMMGIFCFLLLGALMATDTQLHSFDKPHGGVPHGGSWVVLLDEVSFVFLFMVLMVSLSVFSYSRGYMSGDRMWNKFIVLLFMFAFSMILLSLSASPMLSILGWDGLGLSSVGLIFYYCGWVGFRNGMVTFFCNRVGDVFFMAVILVFFVSPTWDPIALMMFLVLSGVTKSAQFPFHIWLPMAMAAPTPVSSLVHSSTLVTAGILIMVRYLHTSEDLSLLMKGLVFLSTMTLILSGISSSAEQDVKKVIALSTLVHLSMIMIFISLGDYFPAMVHLLCHAFMKSGLFMVAGWQIHNSSGSQDLRGLASHPVSSPTPWAVMSTSLLSMVGLPFMSGFCSKELMLSSLIEDSHLSVPVLGIYLGVFFSMMYSTRLFFLPLSSVPGVLTMQDWGSEFRMFFPLTLSSLGSVVLGSILYPLSQRVEEMQESHFTMMSQKGVVLVVSLLALFFALLLNMGVAKKKISYSFSKMNLVPYVCSVMTSSSRPTSSWVHALDKEGFTGFLVKKGYLIFKSMSLMSIPIAESSKPQFIKLFLICLMIHTIMYMYGSKIIYKWWSK